MSAQTYGCLHDVTNLYPHNRSKVAHLHLVQLFKEKDLKLFCAEKLFGHLIADLWDLECNRLNMPYSNRAVKAVEAAVVGDKLGAHVIGGFVENFSTCEHFCCFCNVSRLYLAVNPLAVCVALTPTSHNADVQIV